MPVPNENLSKTRLSIDQQRRLNKAKANSKNFEKQKIFALRKVLGEGTLTREFAYKLDGLIDFNTNGVVIFAPGVFATENGAPLQVSKLVPRSGASTSWFCN